MVKRRTDQRITQDNRFRKIKSKKELSIEFLFTFMEGWYCVRVTIASYHARCNLNSVCPSNETECWQSYPINQFLVLPFSLFPLYRLLFLVFKIRIDNGNIITWRMEFLNRIIYNYITVSISLQYFVCPSYIFAVSAVSGATI